MKKILFMFLFILFFVLELYAEKRDEKTVTIVTLDDYAPFCVGDGKSSEYFVSPGSSVSGFSGYSWDVVRESYHEMGYTIKLKIVPWTRALNLFENGQADILFPIGINKEREKTMNFSRESVNPVSYAAYSMKNKKLKWENLNSLIGQSVGVKKSFNYGNGWLVIAKSVKVYETETILQGFKMLQGERFDFYLGYEYNWDYIISHNRMDGLFIKHPSFLKSYEYNAVLKSNKNGELLLRAFDEGKKKLMEKGRIKELQIKWFGKYSPDF